MAVQNGIVNRSVNDLRTGSTTNGSTGSSSNNHHGAGIGVATSSMDGSEFNFRDWRDNEMAQKYSPYPSTHRNGNGNANGSTINGITNGSTINGIANGSTINGGGGADSASIMSSSVANGVTNAAGLPDFFSQEVFNVVLHNPTTSYQLLKFSQSRFCGENMEFLEKVDRYNTLLDELTKVLSEIHRSYTSPDAARMLNIAPLLLKRINLDIKATQTTTLPAMELIFGDAQALTENILATDVYPRFVKHQLAVSAAKALSRGRDMYAGLGDCFVMTDPAIADLPIVAASDGFVKVTEYPRSEIIPRNCRFLQGKYTDTAATRRLKAALENKEESVELLLNYKKSGTPFWNLLYCAPLFDSKGKVAYILGGQIDVSHTVHTRSDILRVLSASDSKDEVPQELRPGSGKANGIGKGPSRSSTSSRSKLFRSLRRRRSESIPEEQRNTGMERDLLSKIEKMNFRSQVQAFYAAYSKYLVLTPNLEIEFFSQGVADMLLIDPLVDTSFAGNEIFRAFGQYTTSFASKDLRNRIRGSVSAGRAVSADIFLATRRSMMMRENEKFATHWTPLKDEAQVVRWVVVCFASLSGDGGPGRSGSVAEINGK